MNRAPRYVSDEGDETEDDFADLPEEDAVEEEPDADELELETLVTEPE